MEPTGPLLGAVAWQPEKGSQTVTQDVPELEFSPLGGVVTEDDITVQVHIYRIVGSTDGWALEVVDHEGGSTTWEELFPTAEEAHRQFMLTKQFDGIRSFVEGEAPTIH